VKEREPEVKFEKALQELQTIVDKLEGGDLELDESLRMFERGIRLIQACSKRLEDAQRRVDVVLKGKDGKRTLKEFSELGGGADEPDETGEVEVEDNGG
jgi:exodeoxyribonuclease VII small subunit